MATSPPSRRGGDGDGASDSRVPARDEGAPGFEVASPAVGRLAVVGTFVHVVGAAGVGKFCSPKPSSCAASLDRRASTGRWSCGSGYPRSGPSIQAPMPLGVPTGTGSGAVLPLGGYVGVNPDRRRWGDGADRNLFGRRNGKE